MRITQTKLIAIGIRHELEVSLHPVVPRLYSRSALQSVCAETDGGTNDLTNCQHQLPTVWSAFHRFFDSDHIPGYSYTSNLDWWDLREIQWGARNGQRTANCDR